MMRISIFSVCLLILASCSYFNKSKQETNGKSCQLVAASEAPKLLWSTSDSLSGPESVVYDQKTQSFYVSNVAGSPLGKDGKGWISKLAKSGKMLKPQWVSGLNAPKGMRIRDGYIWLSDIDEVKSIHIAKKRVSSKISIPNSKFLNDVIHSPNSSAIYVSDMFTNTIHSIQKSPTNKVFINDNKLENPNGLIVSNGNILIASWGPGMKGDFSTDAGGKIMSLNEKTKKISVWADIRVGNLDGIEMIDDETALVSDWMAGKVFKVTKSGECKTLLTGFKGSADFAYLPKEKIIVIPLMLEDKVEAYQL